MSSGKVLYGKLGLGWQGLVGWGQLRLVALRRDMAGKASSGVLWYGGFGFGVIWQVGYGMFRWERAGQGAIGYGS